MGVAPQLQPLQGMLLRRSTDIYHKELARDMRQFFNSLLGLRRSSPRSSRQQPRHPAASGRSARVALDAVSIR